MPGPRGRLEADDRVRRRAGPQLGQATADDGIAAVEAPLSQLLQEPHGGQIGIAAQQLLDDRLVGIEPAGPPPRGEPYGLRLAGPRVGAAPG